MPQASRLSAKNVFLFRSAQFDFDFEGISVIRGLNRNGAARDNNAPVNSNFIGRSMFFSQIKEIMLPGAESVKSKDRVKLGDGGRSTFAFTRGSHEYVVSRYGHGASSRLKFVKDGVNVSKSGVADQNEYARSLLGMSPTAFEVMHYLDNRIPNPIRTGDTATRRAFFSEFFELGAADTVARIISSEKARLKRDMAVLEELSALKPTENEVNIPEVQAGIAKVTERRDAWSSRLEELRVSRQEWNFRQQNAALLKSLVGKGSSAEEVLSALKSELKEVKSLLAAWAVIREHELATKAYSKARVALREYMAENPSLAEMDLDAVNERLKRARTSFESCKARRDEAKVELDSRMEAIDEWRAAVDRVAKEQAKLRSAEEQLCDACGAPLDASHKKMELRKLREKAASLADNPPPKVDTYSARLLEADEAFAKAKARLAKWEESLSLYANAPSLPPKPAAPDVDVPEESESDLQSRKVSLLGKLAFIEEFSSEGTLSFLNRALDNEVIEYSDEDYDIATDKFNELSAKLAKLEATLEQAERSVAEEASRQKRIVELTAACQNADAIAILDRAFSSSRGVKTLQIKSICGFLEAEVNSISAGMFPETYTFRFDLDTQFNILVTRHLGEKAVTSDVRKLSGAEAGVFDLVMAMALASMTPENRRWNFLVLDELDSNFSPAMTQAFVSFLPRVAALFKHVVVITPRLTDYGRDDNVRYFTVVKEGHESRLLPGKVSR